MSAGQNHIIYIQFKHFQGFQAPVWSMDDTALCAYKLKKVNNQ